MNSKCAFTIVAKNYIGLANILESSIKEQDPDVDFLIFVSDERDGLDFELPSNAFIAKDVLSYSSEEWTDLSFKYDLTAFCTAIKPACFEYLFEKGYEKIIYLDPDIFVFSSMSGIFSELSEHAILFTPHVNRIHQQYSGERPEERGLWEGTYNLGFCALRKCTASLNMVAWWKDRLKNHGFAAVYGSEFYDQKWMILVPGFFDADTVRILRNPGANMAPWNFFERELTKKQDRWYVSWRGESGGMLYPLVFIHFAGYDYKAMCEGAVHRTRLDLNEYPDIEGALDEYRNAIMKGKEQFLNYIDLPYSYNAYENGKPIERFHRLLYVGLLRDGKVINNPFSSATDSFLSALEKRHLVQRGPVNVEKYSDKTFPGYDKNKQRMNMLFKWALRLLGYKRYNLLIRGLYNYSKPENHSFLLEGESIEDR